MSCRSRSMGQRFGGDSDRRGAAGVGGPGPGQSPAGFSIPLCETVERVSAPAGWYRDAPLYVANEQPTEEIRAWAADRPAFEEIWIDRDHLGWITVAFSADAEARPAGRGGEVPGGGGGGG